MLLPRGDQLYIRSSLVTVHRMEFERITIDPAKMRGVPCIRGLRIPVATVLGQLAADQTEAEILADFPDFESEDIKAALEYAATAVQERGLAANPLRVRFLVDANLSWRSVHGQSGR